MKKISYGSLQFAKVMIHRFLVHKWIKQGFKTHGHISRHIPKVVNMLNLFLSE